MDERKILIGVLGIEMAVLLYTIMQLQPVVPVVSGVNALLVRLGYITGS